MKNRHVMSVPVFCVTRGSNKKHHLVYLLVAAFSNNFVDTKQAASQIKPKLCKAAALGLVFYSLQVEFLCILHNLILLVSVPPFRCATECKTLRFLTDAPGKIRHSTLPHYDKDGLSPPKPFYSGVHLPCERTRTLRSQA